MAWTSVAVSEPRFAVVVVADRRRQIVQLIGSRFDLCFEPETFTGKVVRRGAIRGPAPAVWRECGKCGGDGVSRGRGGVQTRCDTCKGSGRRKVDDYTGDSVVTVDANLSLAELIRRDTRRVKCPDCQNLSGDATGMVKGTRCRRCDGSGLASVPGSWLSSPQNGERLEGDAEAALLNSIVRRDSQGSYAELERALAGISNHVNKPERFLPLTVNAVRARRLLDELFLPPTSRELGSLDLFEQSLVELALGYLDWALPDPLRVPKDVEANDRARRQQLQAAKGRAADPRAREQRNKQVRKWAREGRPYQWIAAQVALGDRQVREIINGGSNA